MEINQFEKEDIVILELDGELTLYEAPALKKKLISLLEQGKIKVAINLANVDYIDSSGLGILISGLTNVKKKNGSLKLYNTSESVRTLLTLTKLNNIFEFFESEDEVIGSFL